MRIVAEDKVNALVARTKSARAQSNHYISPPSGLSFSERGSLSIYGADAASDFIETVWDSIMAHLEGFADAKQMKADIQLPKLGRKAHEAVEKFVRAALPGVVVTPNGQIWRFDWEHIIDN